MRERFPIFSHHPELIYLDTAATAMKPKEVIDVVAQFYAQEYATVHRSVYRASMTATEKYQATRESARAFIKAKSADEIVFTRGTTDALNLVAKSYGKIALEPGDEILLSIMEHHSNIVPWQMIAQETGAILKWIPMDEQGRLLWEGLINEKTKIVAVAHISNVTGTIHPVRAIGAAAHAVGAVIVVDGAQAAPCMPIDVQELDADFYAFSGHKCYGPTGVGILYGKRDLLEKMPPLQGGGDMIERVDYEQTTYREPPLRFEAGTPMIGSVVGLKTAFDFIEGIGREEIARHGKELLHRATEMLREIPGLRILGSAPDKGPILTFVIEGVHSLDLATLADVQNIAIRSGHLCAQPLLRAFGCETACRASFGIYNTLEEVEIFADRIKEISLDLCSVN